MRLCRYGRVGVCGRFERLGVAHTCMEGTAFIPEVNHVDDRQQSTAYMHPQQCERSGAQCLPQRQGRLLCSRMDDLPSNHCRCALWQAAGVHQQGSSSESAPCAAVRAAPKCISAGMRRFSAFCPSFVSPRFRVSHELRAENALVDTLTVPQTPGATTHTRPRRETRSVQVTRAQQLPNFSLRPGAWPL